MTVEVWYPLGVAGAGASFVASGLAAVRTRVHSGVLAAAAAGALGALLLLDLVPDVRGDAAGAGLPGTLLVAVAIAIFTGLGLAARRGAHRRGAAHTGLLGPAFVVHGLLEGMAGGTVIGWQASVGVGLVLALVLHKAAEGADLAALLHGEGSSEQRATPRRRSWLIGGAAAPLIGCAVAIVLPLPERAGVVVMTAVCCVLARGCVRLLRRAATSLSTDVTGVVAAAGAVAMGALIALA